MIRPHIAALAGMIAAFAAGCTLGAASSGGPSSAVSTHTPPPVHAALAHYRGFGVAFAYPPAWSHHRRGFITTMTEGMIDLSTQRMVNPCRSDGHGYACSWPIGHLRPGGVVVDWSLGGGFMRPGHAPQVGVHLHVTRSEFCRRIGGDQELSARLVTRGRRVFFVDACLRGPGVTANARAVRAMLASVRRT